MAFDPDARLCLSFDDVLLTPSYSEVKSRHDICLKISDWEGEPILVGDVELDLPIFASPMDTVVDRQTALIFAENGVTPILHRYKSDQSQLDDYLYLSKQLSIQAAPIGVAISSTANAEHVGDLYDAGCRLFCIDVAHGHHDMSLSAVSELRWLYHDIFIIAGNVATLEGFNALADAGAHAVRVGIGGGSVCSTRIVTGHGVPTFQSIVDCASSDRNCYIIADGGMRSSGDVVKALGAGADFVMLGSMFAGKIESPGDTKKIDDVIYKNYRGMASVAAQLDWRGKVSVAEGVDSWRVCTENLDASIASLRAGIQSGISYSGCDNLSDFYVNSQFIRITSAAIKENAPHGPGVANK